jgi:hypothetical protein
VVTPPAGTAGAALVRHSRRRTAPDDIWGIYRDDRVTHYNGTSWTTYTLSGPSGTAFESVSALSPTDVWAGGTNGPASP